MIASNWADLQPQSNPCLIATAPIYKPIPNIDFSIPSVSLWSLIESKWRILPLPNHILTNPSAFPSSLSVTKLLAVILKKGPRVWSWRLSFWALDDSSISDMVGNEIDSLIAFRVRHLNLFFWRGGVKRWEILIFGERGRRWILVWIGGLVCKLRFWLSFIVEEANGITTYLPFTK